MENNIYCGKSLGNGTYCSGEGVFPYLCPECKLRYDNHKLKKELAAMVQFKCGHILRDWDNPNCPICSEILEANRLRLEAENKISHLKEEIIKIINVWEKSK